MRLQSQHRSNSKDVAAQRSLFVQQPLGFMPNASAVIAKHSADAVYTFFTSWDLAALSHVCVAHWRVVEVHLSLLADEIQDMAGATRGEIYHDRVFMAEQVNVQ